MRLSVRSAPAEHFAWIEERTGCVLTRNARGIEAVAPDGTIKGFVAYDGWTLNSVTCHMAVSTPVAWRALLPAVFEYPFLQCGKGTIIACINAGNARSVHLVRRFGFRLVAEVKDGWAIGEPLMMFQLDRAECRWIQQPARKVA